MCQLIGPCQSCSSKGVNIYVYGCSASFMFANAVVDNCTTRVRKCIFSLLGRLTTSTNVIVQSALNSDVYTTSTLQQRWIKALYTCS